MNTYSVIKRPLLSEKTSASRDTTNAYAFEVDARANKIEIKQAIEKIFKVKVMSVNTATMPGKSRRFGARMTEAKPWKKAVATLRKGDRIEIYEGA